MRHPILLVFMGLLLASSHAMAQERFVMSSGSIDFTSDAPLEVIEASSGEVKGVIDPLTKSFAFSIKVNTFEGFNSDLQRSHFNENYLESGKFPKATFTGKIIEDIDFEANGTHTVRAKGKLKIHGITQVRIIRGKLTINGETATLSADFLVPLEDHDITIPKIVNQKIATEIDVTVKAKLSLQ